MNFLYTVDSFVIVLNDEPEVCGLSAGGLAAVVGNPADLALIRMQADGMLPAAERRGYTNVTRGRSMRSAEHTRFLVAKLQRLVTAVKRFLVQTE